MPYRIRTKHSANKIPQGFYIQLRRAGFNQCAPFDILHLDTKADLSLMLVGVDPVALLPLHQGKSLKDLPMLSLMKPPYPILASQDLAAHMQWNDGDFIELNDGSRLGPLKVDTDNLLSGTRLVTDISLLRMLKRSSGLSAIACGEMSEEKMLALKNMLPNGMTLVRNSRSELESLTKAFHMNLTAMGMLSFLVGLFIFYQAMSLSFIQRQRLVGILRQTGVNGMQLAQALMLELTILVLVAWACGNFFGLILANELIPAVSSSLSDLYDANVGLTIGWSWESSLYSLAMSAMGALISCLYADSLVKVTTDSTFFSVVSDAFCWARVLLAGFRGVCVLCSCSCRLSSAKNSRVGICDYRTHADQCGVVYAVFDVAYVPKLLLLTALGSCTLVLCRCCSKYELPWCSNHGIYARIGSEHWRGDHGGQLP